MTLLLQVYKALSMKHKLLYINIQLLYFLLVFYALYTCTLSYDIFVLDSRLTRTRTLNTPVHVYFSYTHINTVSLKTRTFVFLKTREIYIDHLVKTVNMNIPFA